MAIVRLRHTALKFPWGHLGPHLDNRNCKVMNKGQHHPLGTTFHFPSISSLRAGLDNRLFLWSYIICCQGQARRHDLSQRRHHQSNTGQLPLVRDRGNRSCWKLSAKRIWSLRHGRKCRRVGRGLLQCGLLQDQPTEKSARARGGQASRDSRWGMALRAVLQPRSLPKRLAGQLEGFRRRLSLCQGSSSREHAGGGDAGVGILATLLKKFWFRVIIVTGRPATVAWPRCYL